MTNSYYAYTLRYWNAVFCVWYKFDMAANRVERV